MSPAIHYADRGERSQFRRASPFPDRNLRVPGEGPQPCRCMLIGERPGKSESRVGRPFCGISGKYLDLCLQAAAIDRSTLYVTNLVKSFRDYLKPTAADIAADHDELVSEILSCDPEVIVLIGAWSVESVLARGKSELDKCHGVPVRVTELFGGELKGNWIILPMIHPASADYSPDSLNFVLDDVLTLGKLLDGEIDPVIEDAGDDTDYRIVKAPELAGMLREATNGNGNGYRVLIGIDCEGSPERPWSAQVSLRSETGYTIRSTDTVSIHKLRDWLYANADPDRILVSLHYAMLNDFAQLRAMGIDIIGRGIPFVDTGILAYLLHVEPGGLKALCYRHAGMHQESYEDVIGNVGHEIAMNYLRRVASAVDAPWAEVPAKPPKKKRRKKGDPEPEPIPDPEPTLVQTWPTPEPEIISDGNGARLKKSQGVGKLVPRIIADVESGKTLKDGSLVDPRERWSKLSDTAKSPVIGAIGDMPVPTMDDIPLARAVRYASRDADAQFRITEPLMEKVEAMGLEEACRIDHGIVPMIDRMATVGIKLAPVEFWNALEDRCVAQMDKAKWDIYQATGRDINPGSGDQVASLLYDPVAEGGLGLTPPRMTDGGESGKVRGATDDKCLEELLPLSPVVEHVESYREASKIKGTYVEPLRLMATTGDGRARATFKLTRQVTGRITTAEPMNLLSIPIRTELGAECRYGFVAPDGKVIHDADLSTVEMRTFAHLSRDKKLCEIFIKGHEARGDDKLNWDVHTRSASDMFGTPLSSVEKYQRQAGKVINFFIINGGGAFGLRIQMIKFRAYKKDGSRWSEDDCQQMLDAWYQIYPGARRFQNDCVEQARATGLARDPLSGRIRYLPQIWSPIGKVRAEAERCSYSHLIQTSANTILKRAMMAMWDVLKDIPGVEPLLPPHDEVIHELPDNEDCRSAVDSVVMWALTSTTDLIVPIEAESNFGNSWAEAH